mmetsp:Transcript_29259/g.77236  ORF Transcript_29259/g.77236 Transcript_29259/m.77236 type:complete len:251 (+) Transcript_29259:962-1714(+)
MNGAHGLVCVDNMTLHLVLLRKGGIGLHGGVQLVKPHSVGHQQVGHCCLHLLKRSHGDLEIRLKLVQLLRRIAEACLHAVEHSLGGVLELASQPPHNPVSRRIHLTAQALHTMKNFLKALVHGALKCRQVAAESVYFGADADHIACHIRQSSAALLASGLDFFNGATHHGQAGVHRVHRSEDGSILRGCRIAIRRHGVQGELLRFQEPGLGRLDASDQLVAVARGLVYDLLPLCGASLGQLPAQRLLVLG